MGRPERGSGLELLACPLALATWAPKLCNRQVLLFVDNDSAAAGLVRGYSPKVDSCALIGAFWLEASTKMEIYIDRVESKSNPADGPSCWEFNFMPFHLIQIFYTIQLLIGSLRADGSTFNASLSTFVSFKHTRGEQSPQPCIGNSGILPLITKVRPSALDMAKFAHT